MDEYPKAIYQDGDVSKGSIVVHSAEEETTAAESGFKPFDPADPFPKPTKTKKD